MLLLLGGVHRGLERSCAVLEPAWRRLDSGGSMLEMTVSGHHVPASGDGTDAHPDVVNHVEWASSGLTITACTSRCAAGGWCPPHADERFGIALPRLGAWRRRVNGVEQFVDPNTGFFRRIGEITEVAHFADDVHTGTIIDIDSELVTPVLNELEQASGPFVVSPQVDLSHRLLATTIHRPELDEIDVQQRTLSLVSAVVDQKYPRFSGHSRRATSVARRRLVADVCEVLHRRTSASLVEVARAVNYSPFHLSRVFREVMGVTMSDYRMQLRVHDVLMRLEGGERDLSQLAADAGFSDHSHMTRTLVATLGHTPSALRARLIGTPA
jgi:AraC-like DNA-binding protein